MPTRITIDSVRKEYGGNVAISDLTLDIQPGEFFTLLGPSGCGKTTLLRMIAGFNSIEDGQISFNERVINNLKPARRNIGMVFQNYALFPHMSAGKNVAFGLEGRGVDASERRRQATEALGQVHMQQFVDRLPENMSGGQQQRVALARALVINPDVLLMDEPLSNLDAKLRVEMRETIRSIQLDANITTVYVTHDQEEAMAVSDRIAVLKDGDLQQVGPPEDIYRRPANLFVAGFIGRMAELRRPLAEVAGGSLGVEIAPGSVIQLNVAEAAAKKPGDDVILTVRPESVHIADQGPLTGKVTLRTYLGAETSYHVELETGETIAVSANDMATGARKEGEVVFLAVSPSELNAFDPETGQSIMGATEVE